jgi:flagellar biogenesis protein FliO
VFPFVIAVFLYATVCPCLAEAMGVAAVETQATVERPPATPVTPAPLMPATTLPATTPLPATAATTLPSAAPISTTLPAPTPAAVPASAARPSLESMPIRNGPANAVSPTQPLPPITGGSTGLMSTLTSLGQVAGALGVVLGLVFIGRTLVRKFVPGAAVGNGKGAIELVARYPLAKGQAVVLVRIGSQIVALSQGKDRSESILIINDPNEVATILGQAQGASRNSIQTGFNKLLANARVDLEKAESPDTLADPDRSERLLGANRNLNAETDEDNEDLDAQLDEMAAAKRQLLDLREQVRAVRDRLP